MSRFEKYYQNPASKFKSALQDHSTSSDCFSSFNRSTDNSSSSSTINSSTSMTPRKNRVTKHVNDVSDIGPILPRDSIDVLNELKPGLVFTIRPRPDKKVHACVEIDGRTYTGVGKSESIARQAAAENALKDFFVDTIISAMANNTNNDFLCNTEEWKLLGSFAMFKLIEEWLLYYMSQTPDKNDVKTAHEPTSKNDNSNNHQLKVTSTPKPKDKPKPDNKKVLTHNTNAIVLLNTLLGTNLEFKDLQVNKDRPPFGFSLLIDEMEYVGELASSKKVAKQNVARKVLIKKYGYEFPK